MNTSNDSTPVSTPACASSDTLETPAFSTLDSAAPSSATQETTENSEFCAGKNNPQPQLSTFSSQPTFVRSPGETPRAFGAFTAYVQLGQNRSLQAVAEKLGEPVQTVKNWSSKFDWSERVHQINSGLLQKQIESETDARRKAAADWARRTAEYREQEWDAAQTLLNVVKCCLENFGERDLEKMRLSELSRALTVASKMSRTALHGASADDDRPSLSPIQNELLTALDKICGPEPTPPPGTATPAKTHSQN